MKNKMVLLFVLLPFCLFGQRFQGSSSLNFSFKGGNAVGGSVEYETLFKSNISYFVGFSFLSVSDKLDIAERSLNPQLFNYLGETGLKYYFSTYSKFLPFISACGFGGYEKLNNKDIIPSSIIYNRGDSFLYGVGSDVGLEYSFGKISFLVSGGGKYDFSQKNLYFLFGVGFKLYIS